MNVRHSPKIFLLLLMFIFLPLPSVAPFAEAATLTVTTRADSGAGSLRQALLSAIPGDKIIFDTTIFPPNNPTAITLLSGLPEIGQGNLTVDGSNAGVVLDGRYTASGTDGFRITSNGNVIKGLQIIRFPQDGVSITGGAKNNTVGGDWTVGRAPHGEGNIITLNGRNGVNIGGTGTDNNTVSGNLIGLDADGTLDIRVLAMAISPNYTSDRSLFIGSKFHGVWKTTNGGDSWAEVNSGLTTLDVRVLAVSPNYAADGTLFAGTSKGGIFRTTNRGGSWTKVDGGVISNAIQSLAISPAYTTDRHVFAGTEGNGVFASTDGGSTWSSRNSGLNNTWINELLISPNYGIDRTLFARSSDTLYKSINQGYGWTQVSSGAFTYIQTSAISPNFAADQTLFAGTSCNASNPFLKSTDGGSTWVPSGNNSGGCSVNALGFSPHYGTDRTLFAVSEWNGIKKSSDGGLTWLNVNPISRGRTLAISPAYAGDQTLFLGQQDVGGIFKSVDGGSTLTEVSAGLAERGNSSNGVNLSNGAQGNTIGGNSAGKRNVISRNLSAGIGLGSAGTMNNTISGNYIGTDAGGTKTLGNGDNGVVFGSGAQNNRVGGTTPAERNVISGNDYMGIEINGVAASHNHVVGNYIGTDITGTVDLGNTGNGIGIVLGASENSIENNVISGNGGAGITIHWPDTTGNTVTGNYIGTDATGTLALGNDNAGVDIFLGSHHNTIGAGNIIAYNLGPGVQIYMSNTLGNTIAHNSIHDNNGPGIDNSSGGNTELSPPTLISVTANSVSGIAPMANCTIEIFSDDVDEGRIFEGATTSDVTGAFTLTKTESFHGPYLTATATDKDGNTSEFSSALKAVGGTGTTQYTLTATKTGTGTGTVTSNPAGINCGSRCSTAFSSGQSVTLSAAADTGSTFTAWGGDCSGTAPCTLVMYGNRSVTATFNAVATDTTPPASASIVINGGAATTGSQQVTLTLSATDLSGMGQMRFSNDNATWSDPLAFANTASWTLFAGNGQKTVYVKFSDAVGNWMLTPVSAAITLSAAIVPVNPSGLEIVEAEAGSISLKWSKNPEEGVVYNVFRSETVNGLFYRVNTVPVGAESFTWESGAFKISFTDRDLKEGQTYYYEIQALLGGVTSRGYSPIVNAKTLIIEDYVVNVIDPTNIVSVGNTVKYYIQLLPRDKYTGTVSLSLSGVPSGVTPDFIVNGVMQGPSVTGLTLPVSVILQATVGSTTAAREYSFQLLAQNIWTGGISDLRETAVTLTVLPRDGAGIHVEVGKTILRKGERVKIYGSILPTETGKTIVLTLTPAGGSARTKNVMTVSGGKFEDTDWISTLGVGTYTVTASWTDSQTNQHTGAARMFTVEKGAAVLTCLRKTGVVAAVGIDYTVMGSVKPVIPYAPLTLQVENPDGTIIRQSIALDGDGQYARLDNFFTKNGIWKFRVYFAGNDEYIGSESNELVVPVGIDFGRAIILGGGEAEQSNTYWDVTKKLTVAAYRDFKAKGYRNDMIYYLINSQAIDINYDDVPDPVVNVTSPTKAAFVTAVKSQFASVLNSDTPLFIYLQGHGMSDGRLKVLGSDEYLSAADFKDGLDYLQGTGRYQGRQGSVDAKVVVIIEACYSGSFISQLSGPKRVILTSAGVEPYKTDETGRSSFSRLFFAKLLEGESLKKAFEYARNMQINMGYPAPHLDDNGDGIDNAADGLLAANLYLNGQLTWGFKPVVGTIAVQPVLEAVSSTPISVQVTKGDVNIDRVWVQIIAPNANITGADGTISYPELALTRNEATDRYEGTLTDLRVAGIYKLVVFAQDVNKEFSDPGLAYITTSGIAIPGDVNGDGAVNIADAILALQVASGLTPTTIVNKDADVNGDGKIGLAEVLYILQKTAGVR